MDTLEVVWDVKDRRKGLYSQVVQLDMLGL